MSNELKISIIIATKNRLHDTLKCLESLASQTLLPDEVLIIDASDVTELGEKIINFHLNNLIYIHTKAGMTYQWNVGVKNSSGDLIFILDDDTILSKNFVEEIYNVFKNDNQGLIGGVCGNLIHIREINNQDASLSSRILFSLHRQINRIWSKLFLLPRQGNGMFQISGFPTYPFGSNSIRYVECLPGGLTAYRREVFKEFMFDEEIRYMADDEFSYRESRKYLNVYMPYAKIIHNVSPKAREMPYMRSKLFILSYIYYFKKNMPKSFKNRLAFYWAIFGQILGESAYSIKNLDADGLMGFIDGIKESGWI